MSQQPSRENQPTFLDLAVAQRGGANRVLETMAREVDFSAAEQRVAATYRVLPLKCMTRSTPPFPAEA